MQRINKINMYKDIKLYCNFKLLPTDFVVTVIKRNLLKTESLCSLTLRSQPLLNLKFLFVL